MMESKIHVVKNMRHIDLLNKLLFSHKYPLTHVFSKIIYITCLTMLSKFSRRDRHRTYCNKNNDRSLFFAKLVEKNTN